MIGSFLSVKNLPSATMGDSVGSRSVVGVRGKGRLAYSAAYLRQQHFLLKPGKSVPIHSTLQLRPSPPERSIDQSQERNSEMNSLTVGDRLCQLELICVHERCLLTSMCHWAVNEIRVVGVKLFLWFFWTFDEIFAGDRSPPLYSNRPILHCRLEACFDCVPY